MDELAVRASVRARMNSETFEETPLTLPLVSNATPRRLVASVANSPLLSNNTVPIQARSVDEEDRELEKRRLSKFLLN